MPKRYMPPFEDENIILRLIEKSDLLLTLSWRNQDHIRKWFLHSEVIAVGQHYAWFDHYNGMDTDFVFIILAKELNNIPVGQISLYRIDWQAGSAEFGRLMIGNPSAKGKGYAKLATQLVLEYGFMQMMLREIHLEVKVENEPAIAIYKAAGFVERIRKEGLITMSIEKHYWEML